jgi:hypothetical protein
MPPSRDDRLRLAWTPRWPLTVAAEYYDVPEEFLRKLSGEVPGLVSDEEQVDRFLLEKALKVRHITGLTWAALEYGIERGSLERCMREPPAASPTLGRGAFPIDQYKLGDRFVLYEPLVDAWVKSWLPRGRAFATLEARADALAGELGATIWPCAVSRDAGDPEPAVAATRCIVSWDGISLAHKEYLDNNKPLTLAPDSVGWHELRAHLGKTIAIERLLQPDLTRMQDYYARHRRLADSQSLLVHP